MRLLLLAPAGSIHTARIASALAARGCVVAVATYHPGVIPGVEVFVLPFRHGPGKLGYLAAIPRIRRLIDAFKPDVLHAHYLSSYGLAGALCNFRPFAVSAWGTDVFDFPRRGPWCRWLVEKTLSRADIVLSTSCFMAEEVRRYTTQEVIITPFGVDTRHFRPLPGSKPKGVAVIGTVKALEPQYGIETVIRAFAELCPNATGRRWRLEIVGRGSQEGYLRSLTERWGIVEHVEFCGFVEPRSLPAKFNQFTVAAYGSACQESFGVSLLEAQACGVPVVATDVGGFREVVKEGTTGFLVPPGDFRAMAEAIARLLKNDALRNRFSREARRFVCQEYPWERTIDKFLQIYRRLKS